MRGRRVSPDALFEKRRGENKGNQKGVHIGLNPKAGEPKGLREQAQDPRSYEDQLKT